jgi:hypothetical protein
MKEFQNVVLIDARDGRLRALAAAAARDKDPADLSFAGLARLLCKKEAGEEEVNIAQMSEILSDLCRLVAERPRAVLEVLAKDVAPARP